MSDQVDALVKKISELETDLENAFERKRSEFAYHFEKRRVVFEADLVKRHHQLKIGFWAYVRRAKLKIVVTAPFIYALIVPFVFLDLMVTLYQAVCFPVYGIKKARRGDYIVFDRHQLAYLNLLEKLNCSYCSYANGLVAYVGEIASRTEQHWCPIKHAKRIEGAHRRYAEFPDYGDAKAFRNRSE